MLDLLLVREPDIRFDYLSIPRGAATGAFVREIGRFRGCLVERTL